MQFIQNLFKDSTQACFKHGQLSYEKLLEIDLVQISRLWCFEDCFGRRSWEEFYYSCAEYLSFECYKQILEVPCQVIADLHVEILRRKAPFLYREFVETFPVEDRNQLSYYLMRLFYNQHSAFLIHDEYYDITPHVPRLYFNE